MQLGLSNFGCCKGNRIKIKGLRITGIFWGKKPVHIYTMMQKTLWTNFMMKPESFLLSILYGQGIRKEIREINIVYNKCGRIIVCIKVGKAMKSLKW